MPNASILKTELEQPSPVGTEPSSDNELRLTSVFRHTCIEMIRPDMRKSSVICLLLQCLAREGHIDRQHAEKINLDIQERERHGSSAIGRGFAFPHLRTHNVEHFVGAIGIAPEGIEFGALDGRPTKLVLLTLSPWEGREAHMNLLSRLATLMQNKAVTLQPECVYDCLLDLDQTALCL